MKFYSEVTHQLYDDMETLHKVEEQIKTEQAEKEEKAKQLSAQRAARAKEIEEAYAAVSKAQAEYREKLNAFVKDYGSFHLTIKGGSNCFDPFWDLFRSI